MAQDNSVRISTTTLRETAQYVRDRNVKLEDILKEVNTKINQLSNTWKSDASDEVRRKITAFGNNHFGQYKEVVESYASYLVTTAASYEKGEVEKTNMASTAFQE